MSPSLPSVSCLHSPRKSSFWRKQLLWTIFAVLVILWLLGLVSSYTLGGFIHLLLLFALVILVLQLISGRRAVG